MDSTNYEGLLLEGLTEPQYQAVKSNKKKLLVVAGAGSGKTEVMARRVAWWVGVEHVSKDKVIAFTFTERAAEEMKFRIRSWLAKISPTEEISLGNMYIGTIHGFCLSKLREFWPDKYHNYEILDEAARVALVLRGFEKLFDLRTLKEIRKQTRYATIEAFTKTYDLLHENDQFEARFKDENIPHRLGKSEREWCEGASLATDVGSSAEAIAFSRSAARYYAFLHCRRFLDFATSQTEFMKNLRGDAAKLKEIEESDTYLVVDEVQDINPVQNNLIQLLSTGNGKLTAVGDHRQSIYGFRGAKVKIMANLWEELRRSPDSKVVDLQENFRSTSRVIELSNLWAQTISPLSSLKTLPMKHGNFGRKDRHESDVALISFDSRNQEASWIAKAIRDLVPSEKEGAEHDKKDGVKRGLTLSDIAVLVRSSTDSRTYMQALEEQGIPSVVRGGPDLFSQPEVLFFIAALCISADHKEFYGSINSQKSLPGRIRKILDCEPKLQVVLREAAKLLRSSGIPLSPNDEDRVLFSAEALCQRIVYDRTYSDRELSVLRTPSLRHFLKSKTELRRVFPQKIFYYLLTEGCVERWDTCEGRGQTAMFHLGALSSMIKGIETPGWTSIKDYPWQIIGLCQFGSEKGRTEEQPLFVKPEAVTISTIHSIKGLEFSAVFLADVNARRFPSGLAKRKPDLPLSGKIVEEIDLSGLSDNENYDGERRLMYVALTRAERYLFISNSSNNSSMFFKELSPMVKKVGGTVTDKPTALLKGLRYSGKEYLRNNQFCTSYSELRYYFECPHDFYLRKVLGFSPLIDQVFGYGKGIHNLLRAIHSDPQKWARLSSKRTLLEAEIQKLIDRGLFYLRYTAGEVAEKMYKRGIKVVSNYIQKHASELESMEFKAEKDFETLIEFQDGLGGAIISGSIDLLMKHSENQVTIVDFKSGEPDYDRHQTLDENHMMLQVALYALAAKKELEYEPGIGLIRYLGASDEEKMETVVPLDNNEILKAKTIISKTATKIRDRIFKAGPNGRASDIPRCRRCDFIGLCGMQEAVGFKNAFRPIQGQIQ